MRSTQSQNVALWPNPWWMTLVALGAVILCSCRGPLTHTGETVTHISDCPEPMAGQYCPEQQFVPPQMLPPPTVEPGSPMPYQACGPCTPGTCLPWSKDEYLRDGGDRNLQARVGKHWRVYGLDEEDTIAHFDTLDGETLVQPSNRVCIYSPRFGSVRQVTQILAHTQMAQVNSASNPEVLFGPTMVTPVISSKQNYQVNSEIGNKIVGVQRLRQGDGVTSSALTPLGFENRLKPYEDLSVIRAGKIEMAEMAQLAKVSQAAVTWSHDLAPQVILDEQAASVETKDEQIETMFVYKAPPGNPKLRVIKVASTQFAEPGDEVWFTIRFDNVGNQVVGNVTIIDNLTPRLEYVADTAQCSLDAKFLTEANEGGSLVLRCEVTDPLTPGEGGIIRFRCVVR